MALRGHRREIAALAAVSVALGAAYAAFVPRSLPLDEVSYYSTVKFYATHHTMPVLGDPGVTYEGQMGPVYYVPAAVVYRVFRPLGDRAAFYAVRAFSVALLPALVLVAWLLGDALRPGDGRFAFAVAALVGLNPHFLSFGTGVQNDLLSIVLAMLAVYLFVRWLDEGRLSPWRAFACGLVAAAAILTKPGTVFLALALPLAVLVLRRRDGIVPALSIVAGLAVGCGWWFVRNLVLYGELGTREGLRRVGFPLARGDLGSFGKIARQVRAFGSAYWGPSSDETFGLPFSQPAAVKALALVVTLLALGGWVLWLLRRRDPGGTTSRAALVTYAFAYAASLAVYVYIHVRVISLSPKTSFAAYFAVACALAFGLVVVLPRRPRAERLAAVALVAGLVVANVAVIRAAHDAGSPRGKLVPSGTSARGTLGGVEAETLRRAIRAELDAHGAEAPAS